MLFCYNLDSYIFFFLSLVSATRATYIYIMSGIRLLNEMKGFIKEKFAKERWTHKRLSLHLQYRYPNNKGLSVRSLERFIAICIVVSAIS